MDAVRICMLLAVLSVGCLAMGDYWKPEPEFYKCCASGDPHYHLFDGQWIHYQGECKYLLAGTCHNCTDRCSDCDGVPFHVFVDNEPVATNPSVSRTDLVEIHYGGYVTVFEAFTFPTVDGSYVTLPYNGIPGAQIINPSGNTFVFITADGVEVSYQGNHRVCVTVPSCKYRGQMCGICGNMNNIEDDYVTSDGTDVSGDPNKYSLIGNSWEVEGGDCPADSAPTEDYVPSLTQSPCCRELLSPRRDSPLATCVQQHRLLARQHYEACMYDVGALNAKEGCCAMIEAFVDECHALNVPVEGTWPATVPCFSTQQCREPLVYSEVAPVCPPTCPPRDYPAGTDCNRYRPGCVCPRGMFLNLSTGRCETDCDSRPPVDEAIAPDVRD